MVLVVQEEHVGLIDNDALESGQVKLLASRHVISDPTVRCNDNLCGLGGLREVRDGDASALGDLLVN